MTQSLRIPTENAPDEASTKRRRTKAKYKPLIVAKGFSARYSTNAQTQIRLKLLQARLGVLAGRPVSQSSVIRRSLELYEASLSPVTTVAEAKAEVAALVRTAKDA